MKYNSITRNEQKCLEINSFEGGMNNGVSAEFISENELSQCLNVWINEGAIEKRPGLSPDLSSIIHNEDIGAYDIIKYKHYDTKVFYKGKEYTLMDVIVTDGYSYETHNIYLLGNKEIKNMGLMRFSRLQSDTFYLPQSIAFFSGKAGEGNGIYAFVKCVNCENVQESSCYIYEANGEGRWLNVTGYYVPTIYINGRGNKYEHAREIGPVSTATPAEPESINMLNGSFKVYFTGDGYSCSFRLPIDNLSNEHPVTCRVYYSPTKYQDWVIPEGENSITQMFLNMEIIATVEREKGVISFSNSDGMDYAIPAMEKCKENNICISAYAQSDIRFNDVVSCGVCGKISNTLIFSGGDKKNTLYCSRTDNPMYFPKNSIAFAGNSENPITSLNVYKGKVIAFNQGEIYSVDVDEGELIEKNLFSPESHPEYYKAPKLSVKNISDKVGTIYPLTVQKCGDKLVWLGSDARVYSIDGLSSDIKELSYKITDKLSTAVNEFFPFQSVCFATVSKGNYMLFLGNKAFVMNFSVEGMRYPDKNWSVRNENCGWYYWEFDEKCIIAASFNEGDKIKFLCGNINSGISYLADFIGEKDVLLYTDGEDITSEEHTVNCCFSTKIFDMGNMFTRKFIERIDICAYGDMKIEYLCPEVIGEYRLISEDFGDLYIPKIQGGIKFIAGRGVKKIGFRFTSDKKLRVEALQLKYREAAF